VGIVYRNDQRNIVVARTLWLKPIVDVEVGEAIGLLHALKWTDEL
jgi:hypothetical protein